MNPLKRFKALWVLSGLEAEKQEAIKAPAEQKKSKAIIIKKYTPTQEFLKNAKDE